MAKEKVPAEGMTIAYSTTEAGTYTTLGMVVSIQPPGIKTEKVKSTHLGSTIQDYRPGKIPEITDAKFHVLLDPSDANDSAMIAAAVAGTRYWFKITHAGDTGGTHAFDTFQAWVMEYVPAANQDAKNEEADFTLVPVSAITRTAKV